MPAPTIAPTTIASTCGRRNSRRSRVPRDTRAQASVIRLSRKRQTLLPLTREHRDQSPEIPVDGLYPAHDEPVGNHSDESESRGNQESRREASGSIDHDSRDHRRGNSGKIAEEILHPEPSGSRTRARERLRGRIERRPHDAKADAASGHRQQGPEG